LGAKVVYFFLLKIEKCQFFLFDIKKIFNLQLKRERTPLLFPRKRLSFLASQAAEPSGGFDPQSPQKQANSSLRSALAMPLSLLC